MENNAFFKLALDRAGAVLGKRQRLVLLLTRLGLKLKNVEWKQAQHDGVKEKLHAIYRMLKAYATGTYTNVPWTSMLLITAAIVYFVNPLDLIPDVLVGIGFTGDFGVLLMVYNSVEHELRKFITWEKSQVIEL